MVFADITSASQIISAIIGLIGVIVTAYVSYQSRSIKVIAEATHTLVNSNMGAQLRLNSVVSRRLANLTKNDEDIKAANLADKLLNDHERKQFIVDSTAR